MDLFILSFHMAAYGVLGLAELVEQVTLDPRAVGSNPVLCVEIT